MYNNVYEDYIRSIIGKSIENSRNDYLNCGNTMYDNNIYGNSIYGNCEFENNFISSQMSNNGYFAGTSSDVDLEECYPELYRLLYPMIQKVCMKCTRSLSRNVIDEMVEEVYSNFVGDEGEITQININLSNEIRSTKDVSGSTVHSGTTMNRSNNSNNINSNSNISKTTLNKSNATVATNSKEPRLDRSLDRKSEDRQIGQRNPVLNDLIRILILRELLGRPGGNSRPPFGRPPQRPPHNRPNDNIPNFPNSPNFPNFPNRPNPGRPRENRLSYNQGQQSVYNAYPSEMFEDGYNIF